MATDIDQPRLASHCALLYSKLYSQAKPADDANPDSERIWRGKIIDVCLSVGISIGSYSRVVNALRTLGCIEQVERGFRSRPSVYRIHYPPTPEVWQEYAPERTEDLTSGPSSDTMAARLRDLEIQLGSVNLVEVLVTIEQQFDALRKEVDEIRKRLPNV